MKILILSNYANYERPFRQHGECHNEDGPPTKRHEGKVDLVVFTGGTDIDPIYYGQHRMFVCGYPDTHRDDIEAQWFDWAAARGIPMTGICRGAQFGCVMNNGGLYQHVNGHAVGHKHEVELKNGKRVLVNSLHHQMAMLKETEHELIAWAAPSLSDSYIFDTAVSRANSVARPEREPEAYYFPETKFLGVQWHPEMLHPEHEGARLYQSLLKEFIL